MRIAASTSFPVTGMPRRSTRYRPDRTFPASSTGIASPATRASLPPGRIVTPSSPFEGPQVGVVHSEEVPQDGGILEPDRLFPRVVHRARLPHQKKSTHAVKVRNAPGERSPR